MRLSSSGSRVGLSSQVVFVFSRSSTYSSLLSPRSFFSIVAILKRMKSKDKQRNKAFKETTQRRSKQSQLLETADPGHLTYLAASLINRQLPPGSTCFMVTPMQVSPYSLTPRPPTSKKRLSLKVWGCVALSASKVSPKCLPELGSISGFKSGECTSR